MLNVVNAVLLCFELHSTEMSWISENPCKLNLHELMLKDILYILCKRYLLAYFLSSELRENMFFVSNIPKTQTWVELQQHLIDLII